MSEPEIEIITSETLLDRVRKLREQGQRLVQISAARLSDTLELMYSFDLAGRLSNLRILLPLDQPRVPSICSVYRCVLLYENEIHDLFGVEVDGMAVDFKGNLYKTAVKFPFQHQKVSGTPLEAPSPATS